MSHRAARAQAGPTRVPEGKHTLYFWTFAPRVLQDGGWTPEARDRVRDWMLDECRKHTTNMGPDNIIAGMAEPPDDQAAWSPSVIGGDFMGIGMFQHQRFGNRPTPRLSRYAIPGADGLYLAGPFVRPRGAVTGGGRCTAMQMMADLGIDASQRMTTALQPA